MVLAAWAAAAAGQPEPRLFSPWEAKVHPLVRAAPTDTDQEVLVLLGDQADLTGARDLPTKAEKGRYVFEQLTEAARRSQGPLLANLEARGIPHQSFWIANVVFVRARADVIEALARRPEVARIEPNREKRIRLPLPEEHAASGIGLESIDALAAAPEWNLTKVGAPSVWAAGFTGQGVVVAGADTGYDWTHPALKGKYRGWNGSVADHNYNWHDAIHNPAGGNPCGTDTVAPCDDDTHGTHTMGIMVGDGGAGNQVGMAPGARWIGCRNMDEGVGTPARYTECFQWFLAPTDSNNANPDPSKAPDVVNNSWDCPASEGCNSPDVLKNIIENLRTAGIAVVVAGGNEGSACNSLEVPQAYDASISVGATDSNDAVAGYSSRGPGDGGIIKPDIVAPGSGIRSSLPGGGYGSMSGTSMASPHAAGMVALLLSVAPDLTGDVDAIEALMKQTALPKTTSQTCGGLAAGVVPNNVAGYGRIDALVAYNALTAPEIGSWKSQDVGNVGVPGSATYASGTYTITSSGADIGGTSDQFHFVYQPVLGDVQLIARIATIEIPNTASKGGIMIRETLAAGSKNVALVLKGGSRYQFQRRLSTGAGISYTSGTQTAPVWFKLTRLGDTFNGYRSINGVTWTSAGSVVIPMSSTVYVGLVMSSHDNATTATATFDSVSLVSDASSNAAPSVAITSPSDGAVFADPVSVTLTASAADSDGTVASVQFYDGSARLGTVTISPYIWVWDNPPPGDHRLTAVASDNLGAIAASAAVNISVADSASGLPSPWTDVDVGAVGVPGGAMYASGKFTITGSGGGIGGTSDQFHFVYQPMSGDVQITARITGVENTGAGAKGGIMIRETLAPNSRNAAAVLTGANRFQFQRRLSTGGGIGYFSGNQTAPFWVKIVRLGDTFSGYKSINGTTWTSFGSYVIPMGSSVYVGLVVSSGDNTRTGAANLEAVTAGPQ